MKIQLLLANLLICSALFASQGTDSNNKDKSITDIDPMGGNDADMNTDNSATASQSEEKNLNSEMDKIAGSEMPKTKKMSEMTKSTDMPKDESQSQPDAPSENDKMPSSDMGKEEKSMTPSDEMPMKESMPKSQVMPKEDEILNSDDLFKLEDPKEDTLKDVEKTQNPMESSKSKMPASELDSLDLEKELEGLNKTSSFEGDSNSELSIKESGFHDLPTEAIDAHYGYNEQTK